MAKVISEFRVDSNAVKKIVGGFSQRGVANAANKTVERTRSNIKTSGRIDTGIMLRDTHTEFARDSEPMKPKAIVYLGHGQVGVWQEHGTRAHGPARAPFMVFRIRGKGPLIFAKWVRGVTPGKFLTNAYNQITIADFMGRR